MKITLGSIVSYLVGLLLVIMGFLSVFQTAYGVLPLLAGLLILPPSRRWLERSVGLEMNRGAAAAVGVVGVIALLVAMVAMGTSGGGAAPGSSVSNVSVAAADESVEGTQSTLDVEWNARAQSAVDPDTSDVTIYNANDGEKFLVARMTISNTGDSDVELTPSAFQADADGVIYDTQGLFGSGNSFYDATLTPGSSYTGWVAFSLPEGATSATMQFDQEAYYNQRIAVSFTRNPGMAINMSA